MSQSIGLKLLIVCALVAGLGTTSLLAQYNCAKPLSECAKDLQELAENHCPSCPRGGQDDFDHEVAEGITISEINEMAEWVCCWQGGCPPMSCGGSPAP